MNQTHGVSVWRLPEGRRMRMRAGGECESIRLWLCSLFLF